MVVVVFRRMMVGSMKNICAIITCCLGCGCRARRVIMIFCARRVIMIFFITNFITIIIVIVIIILNTKTHRFSWKNCPEFSPFFCGKILFFEFSEKMSNIFFNEIDCKNFSKLFCNEFSSKKFSKTFYCWIHCKKKFRKFFTVTFIEKQFEKKKHFVKKKGGSQGGKFSAIFGERSIFVGR